MRWMGVLKFRSEKAVQPRPSPPPDSYFFFFLFVQWWLDFAIIFFLFQKVQKQLASFPFRDKVVKIVSRQQNDDTKEQQ